MEKQLTGAPHCNSADLLKQVENVIQCDKHLLSFWESWDKMYRSLAYFLSFPTAGYAVAWSADAFQGLRGEMLLSFPVALPNHPQFLIRKFRRWELLALMRTGEAAKNTIFSVRSIPWKSSRPVQTNHLLSWSLASAYILNNEGAFLGFYNFLVLVLVLVHSQCLPQFQYLLSSTINVITIHHHSWPMLYGMKCERIIYWLVIHIIGHGLC